MRLSIVWARESRRHWNNIRADRIVAERRVHVGPTFGTLGGLRLGLPGCVFVPHMVGPGLSATSLNAGWTHFDEGNVRFVECDYAKRLFSGDSGSIDTASQQEKKQKPPRREFKFVPRKAPISLTPKARDFFRALLENAPEQDVVGILLTYQQSSTGEPRMVFGFTFVTQEQLTPRDESVSLEVMEDGTPRSPEDSALDGLPKLYVHEHAFMKVLGCTLDVDEDKILPILYDREGNLMDPNA